jgi:hypothetical protein
MLQQIPGNGRIRRYEIIKLTNTFLNLNMKANDSATRPPIHLQTLHS